MLERQFQASLASYSAQRTTGPRLAVTPRLSLIGTLRPGETVNEVSFQDVTARAPPAVSANTKPALAVAISLTGNENSLGVPEKLRRLR